MGFDSPSRRAEQLVISMLGAADAADFLRGTPQVVKSKFHPKISYVINRFGNIYAYHSNQQICRICIEFYDQGIPWYDLAMALHQLAIWDEARIWRIGNIVGCPSLRYLRIAKHARRKITWRSRIARVSNWLRRLVKPAH